MTRKELLETMSPNEFRQWVAYFSLQDEEYKTKMEDEQARYEMANKTEAELGAAMAEMLIGLGQ